MDINEIIALGAKRDCETMFKLHWILRTAGLLAAADAVKFAAWEDGCEWAVPGRPQAGSTAGLDFGRGNYPAMPPDPLVDPVPGVLWEYVKDPPRP
jgi:hypothetical protein